MTSMKIGRNFGFIRETKFVGIAVEFIASFPRSVSIKTNNGIPAERTAAVLNTGYTVVEPYSVIMNTIKELRMSDE